VSVTEQRPERHLAPDPEMIGRYAVIGRLGAGGMGVVYLARDPEGDPVAVKVIHPALAVSDEFRQRFRSEIARARQVPPFCTAEVLDADPDADPPYLVVEYVDGPSLSKVVEERGPLTSGNLYAVAIGVATALTAIHEAGVVHRDLKPSNVLLAPGTPKVIDFGIARAFESTTHLTVTHQMVGTVSYMAPERFDPDELPLAPSSDVFAWGAVVAYAGTGRTPFHGDSPQVEAARILTQPPRLDGLTGPIRDLVEVALAKNPDERPTARELRDLLLEAARSDGSNPPVYTPTPAHQVTPGSPRTARRHRAARSRTRLLAWLCAGAAAAAALAAAVVFLVLPHGGRPIVGLAGKCVDVRGGTPVDGAAVQLYTCNKLSGQQWRQVGSTLRNSGKCLDIFEGGTENGTEIIIWPCNNGPNQVWQFRRDGTLFNPQSGRCLDVPSANPTDGNPLEIWDCNTYANQRWRFG
jgi:predicted Ser/Thr protein kinase